MARKYLTVEEACKTTETVYFPPENVVSHDENGFICFRDEKTLRSFVQGPRWIETPEESEGLPEGVLRCLSNVDSAPSETGLVRMALSILNRHWQEKFDVLQRQWNDLHEKLLPAIASEAEEGQKIADTVAELQRRVEELERKKEPQ